jgi:hypothetical protein
MNNKLRATIHADFVAAVLLTVLVPLILLLRCMLNGALRHQLMPLLAYWRASALLMVTVYLLIARRPYAMVSGVSARIAIALSLARFPYGDDIVMRWWVWLTAGYCLAGAAINLGQIGDVRVRAEYEQATQIYAQLFHQGHDIGRLGLIGDVGLISWVVGALLVWLRKP